MTCHLRPLRPYQQRAIDGLRQSILGKARRPMLQLPTGAGKTVIAAHIVTGARGKRKRVTFCVPSIGLVDQTFERFVENGIDPSDMGVIQADHPWRRPAAPIQIATAQSLSRRDRPECDVVVIDEAHVRFKVYDDWMREVPEKLFIGLSATPWAKGLGRLYDDLIKPTSTAELIELGALSPFVVYAPSHPDLSDVKTVAGDYHEGQLADVMDNAELTADIVETWLQRAYGLPTLCFATGRAHARSLHDRFTACGVKAAYVDANTPREERDEIGRRLAAGDVQVVCNIGTLTTGIDWDVRALILARPTKSHSLFVQIIGRALRTAPGKSKAIILDHSDTHDRLGMVTDIDFDGLDDGKIVRSAAGKAEKQNTLPSPQPCRECTALIPTKAATCPSCGAEQPKPAYVEREGALQEYRSKGPRQNVPLVRDVLKELGKQPVYSGLQWIAAEKGRKPGWVANTYRDIFDVWPRGLRDQAERPDPRLVSYIRHKDIRWAKSRRAIDGAAA